MSTSQLKLRYGKENKLQFNLAIDGTTSVISEAKPDVFFKVKNDSTGISVTYPAKKCLEGKRLYSITLPPNNHFQEHTQYTGILEVYIGDRYFTPTILPFVFEKELVVTCELHEDNKHLEKYAFNRMMFKPSRLEATLYEEDEDGTTKNVLTEAISKQLNIENEIMKSFK